MWAWERPLVPNPNAALPTLPHVYRRGSSHCRKPVTRTPVSTKAVPGRVCMPKSPAERGAELRALQTAMRDSIRQSKKLIAETERLIAQH